MKKFVKAILNFVCKIMVSPLAIVCKLEEWFFSIHAESMFHICTNIMSILPGLPGSFLRRAFYSLTLEKCSICCHIGFGTLISHRTVTIENFVYVGNYTLIGSCHIGENCYIGSRVSIISGKNLHVLDSQGHWTPYSPERMTKVKLERNVWVGEGAIIMVDVGEGSMVAAGAVVTSNVSPRTIVGGNPARLIRKVGNNED